MFKINKFERKPCLTAVCETLIFDDDCRSLLDMVLEKWEKTDFGMIFSHPKIKEKIERLGFKPEITKCSHTIVTTVSAINIQKSKNSQVAISGNLAENVLCTSPDVLDKLSTEYFKKKIMICDKLKKKKSDHRLIFEDGSHTTIQLKNGDGGGRGWSFDRRSLSMLPTNEPLKKLVEIVCLKSEGVRKIIPNDKILISRLLLGDDEIAKPQHFVHTKLRDGKIISLSACPASLFIDTILKNAYENCDAKRTCVHLTPLIYLQRKGGGKTDHSPDDIQAKLRCMPECMKEIKLH